LTRYFADLAGMNTPAAILIAGRGNNGGDAFAAARLSQGLRL
jgi:NAD(P)H-hydrate repair Nnr-like enzyme with NAD(P)H-hydrate epimerase domain